MKPKLVVKEKGLTREEHECPNCGAGLTLYLDEEDKIRKATYASVMADEEMIQCDYCHTILQRVQEEEE